MIRHVLLKGSLLSLSERKALEWTLPFLRDELSCEVLRLQGEPTLPCVQLGLEEWSRHPNVLSYDRLIHDQERSGDFALVLSSIDWRTNGLEASLQVLGRYQRLLPLSEDVPHFPALTQVLEAHRALHDLSQPLVRADYDHALDTWRWLLRLSPWAAPALQLAALFHDVERLQSEPRARVEQHARDYVAFKTRHARGSARLTERLLTKLGLREPLIRQTVELIAHHERPGDDPELALLNDADCLSFFSLNSWGYLQYFGEQQTQKKVAYTLSRMSHAAQQRVFATRQPPAIASMLQSAARCA